MRTIPRSHAAAWRSQALLASWLVGGLVAAGCTKNAIKVGRDAASDQAAPLPQPDSAGTPNDLLIPGDLAIATNPDAPPAPDRPASESAPDGPASDPRLPSETAFEVSPVDHPGGETSDGAAAEIPGAPDSPPAYDQAGDPPRPGLDLTYSPDAAGLAALCTQTGGVVTAVSCSGAISEFFDTCARPFNTCVHLCAGTCSPISACDCPGQGCFLPAIGCVSQAGSCTVGMDQTCNDNPALSAIHGHCLDGGHCNCQGHEINPATGKCL